MNLASVDLNLFLAFDALMVERSVTRAGQRIGLGQPGMSAALARLRTTFGDELFVRIPGQPMRPTRACHGIARADRRDHGPGEPNSRRSDKVQPCNRARNHPHRNRRSGCRLLGLLSGEAPGISIRRGRLS